MTLNDDKSTREINNVRNLITLSYTKGVCVNRSHIAQRIISIIIILPVITNCNEFLKRNILSK